MKQIKIFNTISNKGLGFLEDYQLIFEENEMESKQNPHAIMLRSYDLHSYKFNDNLLAIARAGAGTNNIPVEIASKNGVVVFNAPGANANAVKELVLSALIMSNRKIYEGMKWVETINGDVNLEKTIEAGKKQFIGPEIAGKTLGVIGLGAIGLLIANAAHHLDMNVLGYDPYISIESAWRLSRSVVRANSMEEIFKKSDYITIHVPSTESTRNLINAKSIAQMKDGVRILNFARADLVSNADIVEAIVSGKVAKYVTDFPSEDIMGIDNIIAVPHLGASTPESEENCAIMAAKQLVDFIENGNIKNSVNYPNVDMGVCTALSRISLIHQNIPSMVGQIAGILADDNINIKDMVNKSRNEYAYTILDLDSEISESALSDLRAIAGVLKVRKVK